MTTWKIETEPYIHVRDSDGQCVFASDYTTTETNNLITAAPELLAVLQEIERTIPMLTDETFQMFGNGTYARMKAAIAKAEGRNA